MTAVDRQMPVPATAPRSSLAKARLPWPVTLYLFCVVIPIGFQAGPLYMTTLRLMLLIVTVPLMIQVLTGRYGRVLITDILFCAHIAWAGVALFVNHTPSVAIEQTGSVGMEFLGGYAMGRAFIRTPETFTALCKSLVVVVCLSLPLVLVEAQTGRAMALEFIRGLPGILTHADYANAAAGVRLGLHRSQFTFFHPIHYGLFCSIVMSLAWVGLKGVNSEGWRLASTIIIGICGFLSLSAGAVLAIALQLGLFIWAAMFARVQARWWILIGLGVSTYVVVDILSNRTPVEVFLSYGTFSSHTAFWRLIIFEWGMVNVWANPIFGLGLNDWERPWFMYSGSMDNFWLVMAVRYGIPGFLLIAVGYLIPLVRIILRDFSSDPALNQLRLAWAFTFVGISFTLCTVHIWTNIYSFIFFVFGAGIWMLDYAGKGRTIQSTEGSTERAHLTFARFNRQNMNDDLNVRTEYTSVSGRPTAPRPLSGLKDFQADASLRLARKKTEKELPARTPSLPFHR